MNSELDSIKYLNFLLDISKNSEIENKLIYKELMALDHFKKLNKFFTIQINVFDDSSLPLLMMILKRNRLIYGLLMAEKLIWEKLILYDMVMVQQRKLSRSN